MELIYDTFYVRSKNWRLRIASDVFGWCRL